MQIIANVNILRVYIERNNLQLELIQYRKNADFIHVYFVKRRIQCNIARGIMGRYQEVSNTNQLDHVISEQ